MDIDELIDKAITEMLYVGAPLTSASIADVASDMAADEITKDTWGDIDRRIRERWSLNSDSERIIDLGRDKGRNAQ